MRSVISMQNKKKLFQPQTVEETLEHMRREIDRLADQIDLLF